MRLQRIATVFLPSAALLSRGPPPRSKVSLMEDEEGAVHLRNLSMHRVNNEEEALNLLFLVRGPRWGVATGAAADRASRLPPLTPPLSLLVAGAGRHQPRDQRNADEPQLLAQPLYIHDQHRGAAGGVGRDPAVQAPPRRPRRVRPRVPPARALHTDSLILFSCRVRGPGLSACTRPTRPACCCARPSTSTRRCTTWRW